MDQIVRRSLTTFVDDVFQIAWTAREHESVSRYVLGHLVNHVGQSTLLKVVTQICIHGAVPGITGINPKGRVNKDLQIWPVEHQTGWTKDRKLEFIPLCIQEWKVFRRGKKTPTMSDYDIDWLCAFTGQHETCTGYAVSLDLEQRKYRLSVTRIASGIANRVWLNLPSC